MVWIFSYPIVLPHHDLFEKKTIKKLVVSPIAAKETKRMRCI